MSLQSLPSLKLACLYVITVKGLIRSTTALTVMSSLIYLLTCNCCQKQYVGQTVEIFRNRWNNYKENARKFDRGEHFVQKHLYEHFTLPGHSGFLHDVSVTLIDKTDPSCPTKLEDYWIDTLKIKKPTELKFAFDDSF